MDFNGFELPWGTPENLLLWGFDFTISNLNVFPCARPPGSASSWKLAWRPCFQKFATWENWCWAKVWAVGDQGACGSMVDHLHLGEVAFLLSYNAITNDFTTRMTYPDPRKLAPGAMQGAQ